MIFSCIIQNRPQFKFFFLLQAGGNFQWPPVNQEQGPTACPMYISPGSRTSSPGPRQFESPSRAAAVTASRATPSRTTPSRSLESPPARANSLPRNENQFGAGGQPKQGWSFRQLQEQQEQLVQPLQQQPVAVVQQQKQPQKPMYQQQQQQSQQQQAQLQQHQNQGNNMTNSSKSAAEAHKEEWEAILNNVPLPDNAAAFTRNFLNQAMTSSPVRPSAPGGYNSNNAINNINSAIPAASAPGSNGGAPTANNIATANNGSMNFNNNNINNGLPAPGPGQNLSAPTRGRGVLTQQRPGMRVPLCGACDGQIRLRRCNN